MCNSGMCGARVCVSDRLTKYVEKSRSDAFGTIHWNVSHKIKTVAPHSAGKKAGVASDLLNLLEQFLLECLLLLLAALREEAYLAGEVSSVVRHQATRVDLLLRHYLQDGRGGRREGAARQSRISDWAV